MRGAATPHQMKDSPGLFHADCDEGARHIPVLTKDRAGDLQVRVQVGSGFPCCLKCVLALVGLLMVPPLAVASDLTIYDEALSLSWDDWSWDTRRNFSANTPVHGGDKSLAVTYDEEWAGLYLHAAIPIDTSLYDRLRFWIHGGASGGQRLRIMVNGSDVQTQSLTATANAWQEVIIPLSSLGSPSSLEDIYWQDISGGPQPVFYLDDIALLASAPQPQALTVDARVGRRPISEDIYGMNFADEDLAAELALPVRRWGGNATSRYNWRTSMTNTAADWFFENLEYGDGGVMVGNLPNGSASDQFVEQNRRTGTQSLLTLPLIGWTTKEGGVRVQLIPRMRDWVDTWYPGIKIALTEYNWGGLESLNGALAAKLQAHAEAVLCDDAQAMSPTLRPSTTMVPPSAPMAAIPPISNSARIRKLPLARSTSGAKETRHAPVWRWHDDGLNPAPGDPPQDGQGPPPFIRRQPPCPCTQLS